MAEPSEANPVSRKPSSSKKHKSKSGKSSHQHSGKSGHHEEHQEHHEVSGQIALGQDENIQGQPETSNRMAELLVGSKQEKLVKKRKSIPKEEAAAIKYGKPSFDDAKRGRDALTTSLAILGVP